ncbi:MAG: NUDIX domain-containing protein [Candidatus Moraniibacteriota bacterium]|nr:MAG: NUDIX domain-containing protein [Candidatus Moranbacteria bacterium]
MPHIHTEPGQIDSIAEVFVVHRDRVLIRFHEKYHIWIAPGGHIELDEMPEETAVREVKEETGLDVALYTGNRLPAERGTGRLQPLTPPMFMNVHVVNANHRHLVFVYFATTETDQIVQPETHEKSDCRWMNRGEILAATDMEETIKSYALKALEILSV